MLRADRDRDLSRLRRPSAAALRSGADGLLERCDTADGRVLGRAVIDGCLRRVEDERRRLEVRLTDAEREDVDATSTKLGRARVHDERRAGGDGIEALGEVAGHVGTSSVGGGGSEVSPLVTERERTRNAVRTRGIGRGRRGPTRGRAAPKREKRVATRSDCCKPRGASSEHRHCTSCG